MAKAHIQLVGFQQISSPALGTCIFLLFRKGKLTVECNQIFSIYIEILLLAREIYEAMLLLIEIPSME